MGGKQKERAVWLALSKCAGILLLLKRHQRQPGSGAVKVKRKIEAVELLHVGRYSMTHGRMCQVQMDDFTKDL